MLFLLKTCSIILSSSAEVQNYILKIFIVNVFQINVCVIYSSCIILICILALYSFYKFLVDFLFMYSCYMFLVLDLKQNSNLTFILPFTSYGNIFITFHLILLLIIQTGCSWLEVFITTFVFWREIIG